MKRFIHLLVEGVRFIKREGLDGVLDLSGTTRIMKARLSLHHDGCSHVLEEVSATTNADWRATLAISFPSLTKA